MDEGVVVVTVDAQTGEAKLPPIAPVPVTETNAPKFPWLNGTVTPDDGIVMLTDVEDGGIVVTATDVGKLICCL